MISRLIRQEEQRNDAQAALQDLKHEPAILNNVQARVDALKDVPAAIDTWKRYPSPTWMVRSVLTPSQVQGDERHHSGRRGDHNPGALSELLCWGASSNPDRAIICQTAAAVNERGA